MNPYVYIFIGIAWLASLTGVGYWQRQDGKTVERAAWQQRENAALIAANHTIVEMTDEARSRERLYAENLAEISEDYQEGLRNVLSRAKVDSAAARSGDIRLFDRTGTGCADQGGVGKTGTGSGGRNGEAGCRLSPAVAEFLIGLANEADEITTQLGACQAVIISDREI